MFYYDNNTCPFCRKVVNTNVWILIFSFLGLQLQGTLYNYYYTILRNKLDGDKTSRVFEDKAPLALIGEKQQNVNTFFFIYKLLYGTFDKVIYKLDKNADTRFTGKLLNNEHQKIIINSLNAVVQEPRGTAYKLSISNPEFVKIGGKTGTSQVIRIKESEREDDQYKSKEIEERFKDHSVFVGYAPYDKPKYIASVIIENGGSGSAVAAPIAHNVLDFAFKNNV